jgi:hypothetical protein
MTNAFQWYKSVLPHAAMPTKSCRAAHPTEPAVDVPDFLSGRLAPAAEFQTSKTEIVLFERVVRANPEPAART